MKDYSTPPIPPAVAHGFLKLFESIGAWQKIPDLVGQLRAEIASQPKVVELLNLARSKLGNHLEAIGALEILIRDFGATSDR